MLGMKLITKNEFDKVAKFEIVTQLICSLNSVSCFGSVISPIDKKPMDGIPSIRVHHGSDFANLNHIIRWTEVFILKV